jgi:hypothetical protein
MSAIEIGLLVLFAMLIASLAVLTFGVVVYIMGAIADRRRRRRRMMRPLSDREVADALAPFGADISIWPSRAPHNGSSYEDVT